MHNNNRSRRTTIIAATLTVGALTLSACGSGNPTIDATPAGSTVTSTMAATSGAQDSAQAADTSNDAPKTPAPADAQSEAKSAVAGATPLGDANTERKTLRPEAPAQLLVTGVRTGKHEGFERVVFDLEGSGTPGWFIDYTDTPAQQASGNPIPFEGSTALNVNIDGTTYPFELGKEDPNIGTVEGTGGMITGITSAGTFEARSQFIIGLNGKHPYSVSVLENPTRLVIDIMNQ